MKSKKTVVGEHTLIHNPGYDFLRLLNWMNEVDPEDPALPFGPYLIETIGIISACCAFEGYINMVGQEIDINWLEFDKGPIPIKDRISRIYSIIDKEIDFGKGIWQKVLDLFKIRVSLVHPKFVRKNQIREDEIPDLFQEINLEYPTMKTKKIIETAISTLLSDVNLKKFEGLYHLRIYSGPPRDYIT